MVPLIEGSAQFKELADGLQYHVDPYSSFGYTWGATSSPIETVVLYSLGGNSAIVANVYHDNNSIQSLYFENNLKSGFNMTNGKASANYGGYSAQYCTYEIFGVCTSTTNVVEAYGNVQVPNTISTSLGASKDGACCAFAEWTGVANNTNSNPTAFLTQGGILWAGGYLTPPSVANSYNMSLFVESLGPGGSFTPLSPPSWITGPGQTITMTTTITGNAQCGTNGPAGDQWSEEWTVGSNYKTQYIACREVGSMTYGWYIFESPANNSQCTSGYYDSGSYLCQIPKFSQSGSAISFTGNICDPSGPCENININSNPIQAYYVDQSTQNTNTGTIAASGNAWTEGWISSTQ